ncbi:hypothetical protein AKJ62_01270 [candidate division MSBL1 archaeon SCGC-AAA259D14]|uniref:Uncharacterized protein n=1 Tax=candidate division MSBL1 archaeon SCGC-AAA259D14 TaxID=1698261 RepID=A0A133U7T5_9EURY|nr:hypothetical protein AKJ62_01270 [candidate division MSBL1 archaeon SCGC-AAA259D14]
MGAKSRRKKIDHKTSRAITIPREMDKGTGDHATMAYDRLILVDPRDEISEEDLLKFLESIEAEFWNWYEKEMEGEDE